MSMSTSYDLLQQILVCPVDPVQDSLISYISKKRGASQRGEGKHTNY